MKFRRHQPQSYLSRLLDRFRPRTAAPPRASGFGEASAVTNDVATPPEPVAADLPPVGPAGRWLATLDRLGLRPAAIGAATFMGMALVGYLFSALILFRTPIFAATRSVPRVLDLEVNKARDALLEAKLKSREVDHVSHPSTPAGRVVWQDPPPSVVVSQGTTVDLSVSTGPQRVPVPDVAGYNADLARMLIESAGLVLGTVEASQTAAPKGVVVNSRPPAGTTLLPGSRVTLVVSIGAPTITVPNLAGMTMEQARGVLVQAGLTMGTYFTRPSITGTEGTVIEQRPQSGTLSAPEAPVDVILARRPR